MLSLCWLLYFSADCGRQHTSNMPIATNWSHYSNCLSGTQDSPICSDHSDQMSKCERFAQIAQDKWATVSESLRSLIENEQLWGICSGRSWWLSKSLAFMSKSLIRPFAHKKWAIRSKNPWAQFPALVWSLKSWDTVSLLSPYCIHKEGLKAISV